MAIKVGVGVSTGEGSYVTGMKACQQAISALPEGVHPDFIIVFSSVKYDQGEVVAGVRSVSGNAMLVGSSTAGEITTVGPAKNNSVAVMAISAPEIKFTTSMSEVSPDATEAGRKIAREIKEKAGEDLKILLMFPDVLSGNGADVVRGALEILGKHFPMVGGASGDDFQLKKTYQYLNGAVHTGSVVALGISGDVKIGIGVKHGWIPVGTIKKVTRSEGATIHEIDGSPAINLYKDYFGDEEANTLENTLAKLAVTYPLGMNVENSEELLLRFPIKANADGSLLCAAEVPEGSEVRLMLGDIDSAIAGSKEAARMAVENLDGATPKAIIVFNCIARKKLFANRGGEEITAIQEMVGADVPLIGFYTYGEQAPLGGQVKDVMKCNTAFHNETAVIVVLGE